LRKAGTVLLPRMVDDLSDGNELGHRKVGSLVVGSG
jgi:hypothetical protein